MLIHAFIFFQPVEKNTGAVGMGFQIRVVEERIQIVGLAIRCHAQRRDALFPHVKQRLVALRVNRNIIETVNNLRLGL